MPREECEDAANQANRDPSDSQGAQVTRGLLLLLVLDPLPVVPHGPILDGTGLRGAEVLTVPTNVVRDAGDDQGRRAGRAQMSNDQRDGRLSARPPVTISALTGAAVHRR